MPLMNISIDYKNDNERDEKVELEWEFLSVATGRTPKLHFRGNITSPSEPMSKIPTREK